VAGGSVTTTVAPVKNDVLLITPFDEDLVALGGIFDVAARTSGSSGTRWRLSRTRTLSYALAAIKRAEYGAVICECDLGPGSWKDLPASLVTLENAPFLIVTSRHADERLWAEALNLGAYDVLAKPFYPAEVIRVITLACQRRRIERRSATQAIAAYS
jgi:DNA-binding response OmpR family regulator